MTAPHQYDFDAAKQKYGFDTFPIARDLYAQGWEHTAIVAAVKAAGYPNDYVPFKYQVEGVDWLVSKRDNQFGFECLSCVGLIGDEMTLGKTAQVLGAIRSFVKAGKSIVFFVPGSTIIQWQKQFDRWVNDNTPDEFGMDGLYAITESSAKIPKGMCVVMSHNMLAKAEMVKKIIAANFDGVVIDEIHKFGALSSKRIQHLRTCQNLSPSKWETCRIGLSGTPTRNYAKEIYNIAHFLDPEKFRHYEGFKQKYLTWDGKALYNPQQFHSDFAPYYIRRTVDEVKLALPPVRRTKLYTEITNKYILEAYNRNVDIMQNFYGNGEKIESKSLLGYLVRLRHITGIAKAQEPSIIEPIRDYLDEGNRVAIGLHHHFVYDRLKRSLREYPGYLIRGGMSPLEKEQEKQRFINSEKNAIIYLSIKAAGEGIDGLQYATRKIITFERSFNGADELQLEFRVRRIGSTATSVESEITIAGGTIDEFYDDMVEYKRKITTQVEDEDYKDNPAFMKQLAERIMAAPRLGSSSYTPRKQEVTDKDITLMEQMGIILDIGESLEEKPEL
jgi:SNF2 family DNA or RNA helicase